MKQAADSLETLVARLPELQWKLSTLYLPRFAHSLPPELFPNEPELTAQTCIANIKKDLAVLQTLANSPAALYLAKRIQRKINALVILCHLGEGVKTAAPLMHFSMQSISTRQQWLQSLHADIATLTSQQQALEATLEKQLAADNQQAVLNLQKELGEIKRRLTLAREAVSQAMR